MLVVNPVKGKKSYGAYFGSEALKTFRVAEAA